MFAAERRRQIAQIVNAQGSSSIADLSHMFGVSEMTIHRDLATLEEAGLLRKTRGGALAAEPYAIPLDYQIRLQTLQAEKDAIGRAAAQLIQSGDTVIVEASTTSLSMVRYCRNLSNVIMYTNSPLVVIDAAQLPGVEVFCCGGLLSKRTMAIVGPEAERIVSGLRPSRCFVGASGFSLEAGVTDPLPLEASVKRKIVEVSQEVYVLATHDKFGRVSPQVSVPLADIDMVITDKGTDESFRKRLAERGIRCEAV